MFISMLETSKKDTPFNKGKSGAMKFLHIGVKSFFLIIINAILSLKFPLM